MNLRDLGIASSAINSTLAVTVIIETPEVGEQEVTTVLPKHAAPTQAVIDQAVRDALAGEEGSALVSAELTAVEVPAPEA